MRAYQVYLVGNAIAWASLNQIVSALRILYGVTLGRKDLPERIPYARRPKSLGVVLSAGEVPRRSRRLRPGLRTALGTVYASGCAPPRVCRSARPIETVRNLIRVEQGKGRKDRYVMLSAALLATLRAYWKIARPSRWLFVRPDGKAPINATALNKACMRAALVARIGKPVTVKTLRHCFATHVLRGASYSRHPGLLGTRSSRPPRATPKCPHI